MSRIGNMPIAIPDGVDVIIDGQLVTVKSGKVQLQQTVHPNITLSLENNVLSLSRLDDSKQNRALHGLMRSLVYNMVVGVKEGFTKNLDINGIGYRASKEGNKLILNVGYSHPVEMQEPEGITIEVPANNKIIVKGADKQLVGETAAKIRAVRLPDAYKGKGIKYDYEVLKLKEGKTGA